MDYRFYLAAKQQSLLSLCTKDLPSNAATNCLQQQMTHPHDTVLLSQASSCFDPRYPPEGVLMNAGRVWLLKDYYWAGRVRKEVFSRFGDDL